MLSLNVLLYVLIIATFKTIVFFICAISVLFDNMLNQIKSNQIPINRESPFHPGGVLNFPFGIGVRPEGPQIGA